MKSWIDAHEHVLLVSYDVAVTSDGAPCAGALAPAAGSKLPKKPLTMSLTCVCSMYVCVCFMPLLSLYSAFISDILAFSWHYQFLRKGLCTVVQALRCIFVFQQILSNGFLPFKKTLVHTKASK